MFTAPRGDTTISLPTHHVGALAGLAWLDTTTPHTEARHMEKHTAQMAGLPVYWLDAHFAPSLVMTGLLCVAATRPRVGGDFVPDRLKYESARVAA